MASPIKIYNYQQTSAPQITSNSPIDVVRAVLTACLVDGFNTKTISTLSVTNNVATATFSGAHGYLAFDSILISGANQTQFNDSWMVKTVPDSTSLTFDITTADVTATGTITCKIAPLGWSVTSHPTASYLKSYRAPTGNRHHLLTSEQSSSSNCICVPVSKNQDPNYYQSPVQYTLAQGGMGDYYRYMQLEKI